MSATPATSAAHEPCSSSLQVVGRIKFIGRDAEVTADLSGPQETLRAYNAPAAACVSQLLRHTSQSKLEFSSGATSATLRITVPISLVLGMPLFRELLGCSQPVAAVAQESTRGSTEATAVKATSSAAVPAAPQRRQSGRSVRQRTTSAHASPAASQEATDGPVNAEKAATTTAQQRKKRGRASVGNEAEPEAHGEDINVATAIEAPFDPPCSVWGLAALAIISQGSSIGSVLGSPGSDPSLAAHTLLMAEFLHAQKWKAEVVKWLQLMLADVTAHCTNSPSGNSIQYAIDSNRFYWHLQVLQHLQPSDNRLVCNSVDISTAVRLPTSMLRKWLEDSVKDSELKLKSFSSSFSTSHWGTMLSCCGFLTGVKSFEVVSYDNIPFPFRSLEFALVAFSNLESLALKGIRFDSQDCFSLGTALTAVAPSLRTLELAIWFTCCDYACKMGLFNAIGHLKLLESLAFPPWLRFVGSDTSVVAPLQHLEWLREVRVTGAKDIAAYGLKFVEVGS